MIKSARLVAAAGEPYIIWDHFGGCITCRNVGRAAGVADLLSSPCRYDEVVNGPLGPVVSATLGQMLDDFFQYAAELQHSLDQQGRVFARVCLSPSLSPSAQGLLAASSCCSAVS